MLWVIVMDDNIKIVGYLDNRIIELLGLSLKDGMPILLGDSNIEHMKRNHPKDYEKYGARINEILSYPDYVAKHPEKDSIEYIKVFDEHVLIAVRITNNGTLFTKTLFAMTETKIEKYKKKGAFKKY